MDIGQPASDVEMKDRAGAGGADDAAPQRKRKSNDEPAAPSKSLPYYETCDACDDDFGPFGILRAWCGHNYCKCCTGKIIEAFLYEQQDEAHLSGQHIERHRTRMRLWPASSPSARR